MNPHDNTPKQGMTSVEAAALLISGGETRDPEKASMMAAGGNPFDLDALQRAHLRRMMGFDFDITVDEFESTITVTSKEQPIVEETAEYSGIIDEKAVDVLVDACLALKLKWEAEKLRQEEAQEGEVVAEGDD